MKGIVKIMKNIITALAWLTFHELCVVLFCATFVINWLEPGIFNIIKLILFAIMAIASFVLIFALSFYGLKAYSNKEK